MNCPNCKRKLIELFTSVGCDWCDFEPDHSQCYFAWAVVSMDQKNPLPLVVGPLYLFVREADQALKRYEDMGGLTHIKVAEVATLTNPCLSLDMPVTVQMYKIYRDHKCPVDEPFVAWQVEEEEE